MQTKRGFEKVFGTVLRSFVKRVLPNFSSPASAAVAKPALQVEATAVVTANETPVATAPSTAKRFRRTKAELKLGLSIEQAMATRAALLPKDRSSPRQKVAKPAEIKALKRFKRNRKEIEAGLSIEQAAALRGVELPSMHKKIFVERKVEMKPVASGDLIETLHPRIQQRANTMTQMRRHGVKGEITTQMLDQAAAFVAAGKVTKCPPCTDSDGYNHLTGQEVK